MNKLLQLLSCRSGFSLISSHCCPTKVGLPTVKRGYLYLGRHFANTGLVLFTTLALSGCVGDILQSKVTEPQTYVLHASEAGTAKVVYPVQLSITLPNAAPGLDSNRMAVLRNDNQLDYYFGARWGSTAPQVVQSFLVSLLQSQQGYQNIVAESSRLDSHYLLDIELQHFQAEYANGNALPKVHVALWATLLEVKSRKAVATLRVEAIAAAKDNRLSEVVAAFQTAMQQASVNLSEQLTARMATLTAK